MKLTIQINGKKHELTAAEARKLRDDLNAFLGDTVIHNHPAPIVVIDRTPIPVVPYVPPYQPFWHEGQTFQPGTICCSSRS